LITNERSLGGFPAGVFIALDVRAAPPIKVVMRMKKAAGRAPRLDGSI
jgi:hypothetical protein